MKKVNNFYQLKFICNFFLYMLYLIYEKFIYRKEFKFNGRTAKKV